ncbi:Carboxymuconolactone decarboxylase family protein [Posidoniimonas corsicana]|uniref:Carboxymuconolactone decarboxylase family protein n=1 Tax=Posidoniimonas corsicana TaxID=1938618 RepID=A0A5C5VJU5_9BACT|nr:peroxidase-related enzyme [Posidoniimonas corsicana]TWT38200.1 Carboxymuconolactone decarboxylase family protein [Posidoniimonas corsicana]
MPRISTVALDAANPQQTKLFAAVKNKLGRVPNLLLSLGKSPAALKGYLDFSDALASGEALTAEQREIVALAVAEANGCEYCLAAHSAIGKSVGLSADAIAAARRAGGDDPANRAVARFAQAIVQTRGRVDDASLDAFRAAGFDDAAVAEVVAHVSLNVLTNYFNNLAHTEVDFPAAEPLDGHASDGAACSTGCSVA